MDVIRRTDLERLALQGAGPSVSLFLPTHRAGPEVQRAPIRLKNLLREATEALQADGVRTPMIHSVLAPLRRLVNDGLFWQYQSDGLALYSRPGWWRALRVPLDLPELAVVADRFHISPLLPLLTGDGHFFVVALSQNQIRLLEGTRDRLEEVHLPGVPLGVRDALHGEEAQKQLQLYVADRGGGWPPGGSSTATAPPATCGRIGCSGISARSTGRCARSWPASVPRWCWPPWSTWRRSGARSTPTRTWSTRSLPVARRSWASMSCTRGPGPSSSPCSSRPWARRPGSTTNLLVPT